MMPTIMIRIEDLDLTSLGLWCEFAGWTLRLRLPCVRVYRMRCIDDAYEITAWLIILGQLVYRASGCVKEPESASVADRLDQCGFKAISEIQGI